MYSFYSHSVEGLDDMPAHIRTTLTCSSLSISINNSRLVLGTWQAVNKDTVTFIAYLFANVEGFIHTGSYEGNGSTNGAFIYTGFKPAYVLVKNSASSTEWMAVDDKRDTYNVTETKDHINIGNTNINNDINTVNNNVRW